MPSDQAGSKAEERFALTQHGAGPQVMNPKQSQVVGASPLPTIMKTRMVKNKSVL